MSVIYIVDHNETIYDVIKTRTHIPKKSPRYQNYLALEQLRNAQKLKKACGTMGPARYPRPDPKNFLRKQPKRYHSKSKPDPFHRVCSKDHKCEPCPPIKVESVKKDVEETDIIKKNVQKVKSLKPKEPVPKFVDTRKGSVKMVENSGLEPTYVNSKTFGKPPQYLLQRGLHTKRLVQRTQDQEDLKNLKQCRYITRQERQNLLDGLKTNWEEMQKEYQLLPIITDTIPKIMRKSKMEEDLKKLEKDIVLIEKHPYIYVLDDEE